ncbi:MAG TPA: DUF1559 domain-containing protein [Verrucomicrobiae bacterium]|nr:DUF1559 domain-containing protein [Verrucomicrobiae bacterium]
MTVIGILGLLAALLLGGLSGAKKKAQQTQCINNVRQLGIALQGFVTEYHVYPPSFVPRDLRSEHPEFRNSWDYALEAAELTGHSFPLDGRYNLEKNPGSEEWVGQEGQRPILYANSWKGVWRCPCAFPPPANFPANIVGKSYGYNTGGLTPPLKVKEGPLLGLGGTARNNPARIISVPAVPA